MSTPKARSTRWGFGNSSALPSIKRVLLTPESVCPSDERMTVIGVLNPAFARTGAGARLFLRVDEAPAVTPPDAASLPVALVCPGKSPPIDIVWARLPSSFNPRAEPILPRGLSYVGPTPARPAFLSYVSHIREVTIDAGRLAVAPRPLVFPSEDLDLYGCEDPRATLDGDELLLTYSSVGLFGVASSMLRLKGSGIERTTLLTPDHKHTCIFPRDSGEPYAAITRPLSRSQTAAQGIWLIRSPDAIHWGDPRPLLLPRKSSWDCGRVGPAAPPIRLGEDWLLLYYGIDSEDSYHVGAAILNGQRPEVVRYRSKVPLLSPDEKWECNGRRADAVFACGADVDVGQTTLTIYYGAADQFVATAAIDLDVLIASLSGDRLGTRY